MRIIDMVGNTPLITLSYFPEEFPGVSILAKAEFMNPSGSVKDRAAKAMILDGIARGKLTAGKTIIDATSGNTGIAYAMLGAALGYDVVLFMPQNTSAERKNTIRHYGAKIVETDPLEGSDGAYLAVREQVESAPERYFYPDQYNNTVNPETHFATTGWEIWQQSQQRVTHFIASMGTSGSFVGSARRLKQENPQIKTLSVQPASPLHGIEGTKHMASSIKPGILDETLQDGVVTVTTEEAYASTRNLAKHEGLFVGISSGANVAAAVKLARTLPAGSVIVTLLCDTGSRYLTDPFWNEI
ncbi:PLP-dependent cysteine synthase family protein [Yersinia kristensenii]|uniref:cysteine synthase n=2 Tax=Yersinia kristensenii TaxID=28152 RepID=A0A0T9KJB1_YERKR|nr:cysteine synthase family protein [Yersinia kristensenii]MDA5472993.1 cysteine synthase family protein [Yersinia kristensenii]MDA5477999.1 cysteine synthase family protein [Yersinia kristensenii]MDA5505921.1 cysteine synthase family protein [Yersinia kristensenii]NIK96305.1 cysteine synthase family protein [Yersinia kristensenii]NIL08547.1 cysteine synthase family protein [Yersinia kristensenii]